MFRVIYKINNVVSGNKNDLESIREVPFSIAHEFAEYNHMVDALETSAKDNSNIEDAFLKLAKVTSNQSKLDNKA